ncbi:MAG: L-fucose/L-arabinose isomerase family protein [Beijerinckiaceae bacterium]
MKQPLKIAVLPLARPTFDVPFAEEMARRAFAALDATGNSIIGPRTLLFDAAQTQGAIDAVTSETIDLVLILQVTFTDATMTVKIAEQLKAPLAIWAFPEPRTGGRLRLNAFCGLNLASHALGRAGHPLSWLYGEPERATLRDDLRAIVEGNGQRIAAPVLTMPVTAVDQERARAVLAKLQGKRIGLIGEHPAGFDTCRFEPETLRALAGIEVDRVALPDLFHRARAMPAARVAQLRDETARHMSGLDGLDQPQLEKSLQLYSAFDALAAENKYSGLAVRCWPEMFTEFGCAACGPMGFLTERNIPCACEADMYGAVTSLLMQELAGAPSYLVDIVDMDADADSSVVWHCGSAPRSMADSVTPPAAQIHSNRKMPLLQEFALKPGRVTVARISQARNETTLYVGGGEMLRAPKSFSGTSGVLRFDAGTAAAAARLLDERIEHHVALVYGDHRAPLAAIGEKLGLPVKELG